MSKTYASLNVLLTLTHKTKQDNCNVIEASRGVPNDAFCGISYDGISKQKHMTTTLGLALFFCTLLLQPEVYIYEDMQYSKQHYRHQDPNAFAEV